MKILVSNTDCVFDNLTAIRKHNDLSDLSIDVERQNNKVIKLTEEGVTNKFLASFSSFQGNYSGDVILTMNVSNDASFSFLVYLGATDEDCVIFKITLVSEDITSIEVSFPNGDPTFWSTTLGVVHDRNINSKNGERLISLHASRLFPIIKGNYIVRLLANSQYNNKGSVFIRNMNLLCSNINAV